MRVQIGVTYDHDLAARNAPTRFDRASSVIVASALDVTRSSTASRFPSHPVALVVAAEGDLAGSIRDLNLLGGTENCVSCVMAGDATLSGSPLQR
ncbi:MAG: hypothetical protein ABR600_06220 [Actinomycetota bacterium]|nr:hypothetical protein [Actinomycetota bacterium]